MALHPESGEARVALPRAALAGVALGVVGASGASLVVYESSGLRSAATGVVATLLLSLLLGVWAGAPAAHEEALPLRERWVGAGVATALAGAFATVWTLYGGLAGWALAGIVGLLVLVALPAYALGLLLPVLLAWGERREAAAEAEAEDGAGEGWGALGEVVMGALGGVSIGVVLAGIALIPWLSPGPLLLATSIALILPAVLPEPPGPEPRERLLHEVETPFGVLRVTERRFPGERQPERRLYLGEEQESGELVRSGAPTLPYVAAAEQWLAAATPAGARYLFLGGGAYTLPRRVAERDPRARITVVELDPEATRLAYRFFGLRRDHGIASVHGDARAYLEHADGAEYDRVYLDVYGGREALPFPLVTREAFSALRRRLRPGGMAALNLIGVTEGPESLRMWSVVRTARDVFPSAALYLHLGPDYPDRQNVLVALSPDPDHPFPPRAGLFARWPEEEWPRAEGAVVLRDLGTAREPVAGKTD